MVLFVKIDAMSQNCHVLTTVCWEFSKELFDLELYSGLLMLFLYSYDCLTIFAILF